MTVKSFYDTASELDNVFLSDMTMEQARELAGSEYLPEELSSALDEAQGKVFSDAAPVAFVVIRIRATA